jgi:hypothetical protein
VLSRPFIRVFAGVLTAIVFLGVGLALGFTVWAGRASGPLPHAGYIGWLMPVIAAGLVGLLAWALLSPRDNRAEQSARAMVRCRSCDANMMQGWRLCPYCGAMKEEEETPDE